MSRRLAAVLARAQVVERDHVGPQRTQRTDQQREQHPEQQRADDADRREAHQLLSQAPGRRLGHRDRTDEAASTAREAVHHPGDTPQIALRGAHDVDPGVRVVHPIHGHFMDAQPVVLGEDEELGIEEPTLVLDHGQEAAGDIGPHGLEATLGVGEPGPQRRPQDQVVARARSPRALRRARPARPAPAGCRWRRRCGRRREGRRAGGGHRGRSTDPRPCRPPRSPCSPTTPPAALAPGPSRRGAGRGHPRARWPAGRRRPRFGRCWRCRRP